MSNNSYKKFEDLDLLDSFLFIESTTKQENAKFIAKVIIKRVFGWDVSDISVDVEKPYQGLSMGSKGIRLDLQVTESENGKTIRIYDIEPNKYHQANLPKRSRYYLSLTDAKFLNSSQKFSDLPDYFSVWILPYDPFGDGRMVYTVKNQVVENPQLVYNEGVTRIFLYTDGEIGGNESLYTLLRFFKQTNELNAVDSELQQIQSIIGEIKHNKEVGERYMTLGEIIDIEKDESYKEGYYSGLKGSHPDKPVGSLSKHRSNTLLIAK